MNEAGTQLVNLTNRATNEFAPTWSADGTRIVSIEIAQDFSSYIIWRMDADGTNQTMLTSYPFAAETSVDWSPNGDRLTYHGWADGDYDVYVLNSDGSGLANVTNSTATKEANPRWGCR